MLLIIGSCKRQDFGSGCYVSARIFVDVNWDDSGINPSVKSEDYSEVHRVSLRFFPKDGSAPFEHYLESSVYSGYIEVPVGEYSIMAMNESVTDVYWSDRLLFTDINDFNKIAATVAPVDPSLYRYYAPTSGELFVQDAHKLASWSIDDFSVTPSMVNRSRLDSIGTTQEDIVIHVKMRRLTYDARVLVTVKKLKSAHTIQGAMRGFSQKVYLSSAETAAIPSTKFFKLREFMFDADSVSDGIAETSFQTFGKLPVGSTPDYSMMLDVVLIDGSTYTPPYPFEYDLTEDVEIQDGFLINIAASIELPHRDGDEHIAVGDWDDEEHIDL